MSDPSDIVVRHIAEPPCGPLEAYARLRAHAPDRGSFLLESLQTTTAVGRTSVVGYRARQLEMLPPGVDALTALAEMDGGAKQASTLGRALTQASIGFVSSCCANQRLGIQLFEDEGPAAVFLRGATVLVFDHRSGDLTVAGPAKGRLVDRCLWELEHEADAASSENAPTNSAPTKVRALPADDKLAARAARAQALLGPELSELVLAQTYMPPPGKVDPLDIYRRLRANAAAAHGYVIDLGAAPGAPAIKLAGTSDEMLCWRRDEASTDGGGEAAWAGAACLADALPHPRTCGQPAAMASKMIRRLEDGSRQLFGGAVGFACPSGACAFALANRFVALQSGGLWCTVAARLGRDSDPTALPDVARAAVEPLLAAIAAAEPSAANH